MKFNDLLLLIVIGCLVFGAYYVIDNCLSQLNIVALTLMPAH